MGKKYKLIKKFPGSAPVGTIIDLDDVALGITCNYTNYPEFWEEIIEKDYEILEYKSIQGLHCKEGQYCFDVVSQYGNPNEWFIYKIRRKSDGVEFKIGDKVCWKWAFAKNKYFTIKSFNIIEGTLKFNTIEESAQNFIFELVSKEYNLQHYKEPILTTEDGYECTLDDRVFGVLPKGSWDIRDDVQVKGFFDSKGNRFNVNTCWKFFKTAENRDKYIYENKPEFSRKQILDAINSNIGFSVFGLGDLIIESDFKHTLKL